ncbi:hypothetical protein [Halorubrum sp. 2020YC2]|uniref:DUF7269 family protein n=1 Tax=Halorubrum sp. 2020YC2 TaxID=2836432 RepID=UPI001BEA8D20|nr:hypothetical protein [Halorubrum sp. 2020YC2]QWC18595.1 hypothetical protein KI388_10680 [Halorubrum sp. 2020YC2]
MIRRLIRALVALVGIALIGGSAALLFAPEAVEPTLPIDAIARSQALSEPVARTGTFAALGVGAVLWTALTTPSRIAGESGIGGSGTGRFPDFEALRADPPETATSTPVVGSDFERRIETAKSAATAAAGRDDGVRGRLRSLAVETLVTVDGCSREAARDRVDEGSWTDDAVAAAYVADREATLPFWRRLLAWLRPAATRTRRIERAADAIATRATARPEPDADGGDRA